MEQRPKVAGAPHVAICISVTFLPGGRLEQGSPCVCQGGPRP